MRSMFVSWSSSGGGCLSSVVVWLSAVEAVILSLLTFCPHAWARARWLIPAFHRVRVREWMCRQVMWVNLTVLPPRAFISCASYKLPAGCAIPHLLGEWVSSFFSVAYYINLSVVLLFNNQMITNLLFLSLVCVYMFETTLAMVSIVAEVSIELYFRMGLFSVLSCLTL